MAHEFDGEKYEKASTHQREWGMKLISELSLKGDEHVLDLGCGDGANTAVIAELLPEGRVVGIDASNGMIEAARNRERDNLRFMLLDIDDISFTEEFDVVFSNAALHWVKDHVRLLKNVHAALRDGGIVRFNFAGEGNCSHFFKVIRKAMNREAYAEYFKDFSWPWYMPSVEAYSNLVLQSDLKKTKIRSENADRFFPDEQAMIRWLDQPSLVPFLSFVPDPHKTDFRNDVVREMIRETRRDDGRCFETFRRINLHARKWE